MDEMQHTDGINGGVEGRKLRKEEESIYGVINRMAAMIFVPNDSSSSTPAIQRIKACFSENGPLLKDATRNASRKVMIWTRRGGPLRALFVISVGTITLLALTGLLVFMLFFLAATVNAIIVSLLISLAAAGGFLAIFFVCMTAIYVGALSVAVFVISTATISAIVAVLIATGWIGFFWTVWLVTKKSVGVAKHSVNMTGSAISAYTSARNVRHHEPNKLEMIQD
ncbi:hypothetical protein M5689_007060 [Euphorbia peplus]|nr:hypothetical protein M5689_007060 [Euphorbia peplus]